MDPNQLASEKPADLDLHCYQNMIYPWLLSCQPRVTVTSCFVYKVIRDF